MTREYQSYAGFTIGPIVEVIASGRKTREIWFGSFFFSWFVERLLQEIHDKIGNEITLLTPYWTSEIGIDSTAGIFPDHFILASTISKDGLTTKLKDIESRILTEFAQRIDNLAKINPDVKDLASDDQNRTFSILRQYLQTAFVVLPNTDVPDKNPVAEIEAYLTALELKREFQPGEISSTCEHCLHMEAIVEANVFSRYGAIKKTAALCPLCFYKYFAPWDKELSNKIGAKDEDPTTWFISTGELSARELIPPGNSEFKKYLEEFGEINFQDPNFLKILTPQTSSGTVDTPQPTVTIRPYHRYIAIIYCDGDSLGKFVRGQLEVERSAGDYSKFQNISRQLYEFGQKAAECIREFQGIPIFVGGDDVLGLLPLAVKQPENGYRTALDCVRKLNSLYAENMHSDNDGGIRTSLSAGMSVIYYKFPLSLGLDRARELLFSEAKYHKSHSDNGEIEEKNALAMQLTQHAGHSRVFQFGFDSEEMELFCSLLQTDIFDTPAIPHSFAYHLERYSKVLSCVNTAQNLKAFIENQLEPIVYKAMYDDPPEHTSGIVRKMLERALLEMDPKTKRDLEKLTHRLENTETIHQLTQYLRDQSKNLKYIMEWITRIWKDTCTVPLPEYSIVSLHLETAVLSQRRLSNVEYNSTQSGLTLIRSILELTVLAYRKRRLTAVLDQIQFIRFLKVKP